MASFVSKKAVSDFDNQIKKQLLRAEAFDRCDDPVLKEWINELQTSLSDEQKRLSCALGKLGHSSFNPVHI